MEISNTGEKIKVFAYTRKSTEDTKQGDTRRQVNSLQYQKKAVEEIAQKNNLKIVEWFSDSASGYTAFNRPNFEEMLERIRGQKRDGEVRGIVCFEHNRLARNFADGGLVLWYLQDGYIDTIYTYDKIFSRSSSDQMMLAINFAMAKHASDEIGMRGRQTNKLKATDGQPPNRIIPGYRWAGKEGKRVWQKDPKTAPLIVRLFNEYATGRYTLDEIANLCPIYWFNK